MKMVFEDNRTARLSRMLVYAYNDDDTAVEATPLDFTEGDYNMLEYLQSLRLDGTIYVLFIDVVPDNPSTIVAYKRCASWRRRVGTADVFLIPIPCIEYYVIKRLFYKREDDIAEYTKVVFPESYRDVDKNVRGRLLSTSSFETYCKSVLHNIANCTKEEGNFYLEDCLCDKSRVDCHEESRVDKAWGVITGLPIYANDIRNHVETISKKAYSDSEKKAVNNYYKIAKQFLKAGYISDITSLEAVPIVVKSIDV